MTPPARRLERLRERRSAMRRFYLLTAGSVVIPGLGLLGTRWRRAGAAFVGAFVLLLLVALVKVLRSGLVHTALTVGVNRRTMLLLIVGIVIVGLGWLVGILLTGHAATPPRLSPIDRTTTRLFTAFCCCLVVFPSAIAVRGLTIQRDVVASVFGGDADEPVQGNRPNPAKDDPWRSVPRVNLLLLGSDAGADRTGVRTDSMIVASINTRTGDSVLFGIPRNLENVPFPPSDPLHALFPQGFNCGDQCLMNAVWTLAEDHRDLFPGDQNPGLTATRDAIGETLGLKIDNTVIIDLKGFQQLVDAMGGVDINVRERVCVGCKAENGTVVFSDGTPKYIETGPQHLDGYHALWYARSRAESDDFNRMRRQRCVVGALVSQVNPVTMLARYGALAAVLKANVSVDIRQDELPAWVTLVERIQRGTISSLPITDRVVNVTRPDFAKIRELVQKGINPTAAPTTTATSSPSSTATRPTTPGTTTSPSTSADDTISSLAASC